MLGDHGLYLKGPHFYEEALRVPLVMHWPEGFKSGVRCDALVELLDLAPTFCEAAGIPVYEGFQGNSLTNICRGETSPEHHRDFVLS